ncbi:MAG: hypothetical protein HGN29_16730 [Asgard group archaeon]|nr:hypothetical protein [Asgard group archaeon]
MNLDANDPIKKFMTSKYEKLAQERYFTVSDGSELRVLLSNAQITTSSGFTLLLIPGWNTVVPSWEEVLLEAMKDFDIIYIETREKGSSKLNKKTKNNPDRFSSDVKEILEELGIEQNKLVIFASSFGVFFVADGLASEKYNPFLTFFLGPSLKFNMPPTTKYIMHVLPNVTLELTKPIWRWWIRTRKSENPEQAAKYIRALEEADASKWRSVSKRFNFVHFGETYKEIKSKVIVIGMEKDKMHKAEEARSISQYITNSAYIDMGTNKLTHSIEMVEKIRTLIKKKEK